MLVEAVVGVLCMRRSMLQRLFCYAGGVIVVDGGVVAVVAADHF